MAAARVVKLKEGPKPKGPAIRLYRSDDGFSFIVGCVDKDGVTDFRTESLHNDFNDAVKAAEHRVGQFRLPLINDTGVPIENKAQPAAAPRAPSAQTKALPARNEKTAAQWEKELEALPDPLEDFRLPQLEDGGALKSYIEDDPDKRAYTLFCALRQRAIETHERIHGDSRDHVVTFSQKTYDQLQTQIRQLYSALLDEQVMTAAYLEAAFDRIEELERRPKGLEYRGVYSASETYEPSDVCTWGGSAWICKRQTTEKPGDAEGDDRPWQLMVRKGRDGKDLRHAA